jgi:transcriptional regulator of arginine metabolism
MSSMVQDKNLRQQKLLSLIRSKKLSTQTELVKLLRDANYEATQSSVSRDLDELGVIKVRGTYQVPGTIESMGVTSGAKWIKKAGDSLLVIRCESGFASALTVAIDQVKSEDIVGTIAGDDTIFIAIDGRTAQNRVYKVLSDLFQLGPDPAI